MKELAFIFGLLTCFSVHSAEPFVKTYYNNKNWAVMQVGMTGQFKQCALRSSMHFLDKAKNPKYGATFLEVSYPSNNITFSGENIGAYFKISKGTKLQIDNGAGVGIRPETPLPGKDIVDIMLKGKVVGIEIDFSNGESSTHKFSLSGFAEAYKVLPACAK